MAEYIEREKAYQKCGWYNTVNGKSICAARKDELAAIPAADVAPVRHGRWLKIEERMVLAYNTHFTMTITSETCSECNVRSGFLGKKGYVKDNSCPNCGAKMDLEV